MVLQWIRYGLILKMYLNAPRFSDPGLIVVLSGGGDFMLKIWSALDGTCPVTMKGHVKRM